MGAAAGRGATGQGEDGRGALLDEREATHGNFSQLAHTAQALKRIMRDTPNWATLTEAQREALECKATKLARILCGEASFPDHWRDDIGYSQLALERMGRWK